MSCGSQGQNTVTQNSSPPPQVLANYSQAFNMAQNAVNGPNPVAPLTPQETSAINSLPSNQTNWQPYNTAALSDLNASTTPLYSNVGAYESPYTADVVNATQNQFANQNAIQQQGIISNAVASGAFGGDRSAVAQGITAGQQQLAEAPVIAGLENTGYTTGLQAEEAQAALAQQAGAGIAGLGQTNYNVGQNTANSIIGGQQLIQQNQQQNLSLPYTQASYLANIAEGLGAGAGGTSSTTSPGPSTVSQIAGVGLGGVGLLGATGAFGSAGWLTPLLAGLRRGGRIPHFASGGITSDITSPDLSIIPPVTFTHTGLGPPKPPAAYQNPNPVDLTPGGLIKMGQATGAFGANGWLKSLAPGSSETPGDYGGGPNTPFPAVQEVPGQDFGGGGDYRRGGIVPEPRHDLRAQFHSMLDPRSAKDSVFVARRPEGTLFTTHIGKAHHFARGGVDDASMAGILGYPETKAQAMASGSPRVVPGISPHGHVVYEAAASPHGEWVARNMASRHAVGGLVRTVPVAHALARRMHFARGGIVGYDDGGLIDDPAADVQAAIAADPTGYGAPIAVTPAPVPQAVTAVPSNWEVQNNNFAGMRNPNVPAAGGPLTNPQGWQSFATPEAGIAGISHQLDRYASGATTGTPITTLRGIVSTWAPPTENDTNALVGRAAKVTGFDPDQPLDMSDPGTKAKVVEAMIRGEQGGALPVDPALIASVTANPSAYPLSGGVVATTTAPTGSTTPGIGQTASAGDSDGTPDIGIVPRATTISQADAEKAAKSGDVNPWLALAAAGFGIASGRSPHPLQNIGAGALEGLQYYQQLRQSQPDIRLKNAQADVAEATAGAYKAQQEWTQENAVNALNGNLKALKPDPNSSPTTQAIPAPGGGAVARLPETPSVQAPTVSAPTITPSGAQPAATPQQQQLYSRLDQQYAQIDSDIAHLRTFPAAPGQQLALQQAIIAKQAQRVQLQDQDPRFAAAKGAATVAAETPGLVQRAGETKQAELPYVPWDVRPGGTHGVGNTPVYTAPIQRSIVDLPTGREIMDWAVPPMPGQVGATAGAPIPGAPVGSRGAYVTRLGPGETESLKNRAEDEQETRKETLEGAQGAQNQQAILTQMKNDAANFYTGPFSNQIGEAQKIGRLIGMTDPDTVASRESFIKNAGALTRAATHEASPRAAFQEMRFIDSTLPNPEMSPVGLQQVLGEYQGLNDYKIAKAKAQAQWEDQHGGLGHVEGFESAWQANAPVTPYTFVISRMAQPERQALFAKWNTTDEGRATLQRLKSETTLADQNGWLPSGQ